MDIVNIIQPFAFPGPVAFAAHLSLIQLIGIGGAAALFAQGAIFLGRKKRA